LISDALRRHHRDMRAILALFGALLVAACDHHVELAGPAGLPYACSDGRAARIFYDRGDPNRAPARLELGGDTIVLMPAPAMSGLRYVADSGLAWLAEGDEAVLSENGAGGEREIARCSRVRAGETAAPDHH
jgi:membrane-bound inhibitor of C-type lysozyme